MRCSTFFKNKKLNLFSIKRSGGFTLTELLVVMAIATIMMTVLVIQQSEWNDRLSVNTQAYELALMIRQAQIYSLGVREDLTGSLGDKFNVSYGVYLNQSSSSQYIFYADRDGDRKYDSGEALETKTFIRGVLIDRFCGLNPGGQERCSPDAGNIDTLHISFLRPNLGANIFLLNNGGNQSSSVNPPAIIYLKSPKNKLYKVRVETNGQVSITQV
jgi:prepilin-type N-terminal cleavage/methylation domain-containing protein